MNPGDDVPTLDLPEAPAWFAHAECRGYGLRFTTLPHEEAVRRFCRACPVKDECLEHLFDRVKTHGLREMIDGNTVCGGIVPAEQHAIYKAWRAKQQKEKSCHDGRS